ncbi:MAG: hypothetical protein MPJ82_03000 [Alphaproteobacteria bacterium]|nr:hypothetical protein [Alphaproteobacteria bacterium]
MKQQTVTPRIYFLRAAPAGVSGRLSDCFKSLKFSLTDAKCLLFGTFRSAAPGISGRELWTGHGGGSSERHPLMPVGAADKIKICSFLIKGQTTITGSINQPLALVGEGFRLLKSPLKRAMPADARGRCPQKIKFVPLIKGTDDDHGDRSIGAMPLALAGEGFRLLKSPLKRTAPADARGRRPQKIKFCLLLIKGQTTITASRRAGAT